MLFARDGAIGPGWPRWRSVVVEHSAAFAQALDRAYRSIRLYPGGHPSQTQVVEAAARIIKAALAAGDVALEVHPGKLISDGAPVLEAAGARDSVVYPLARDGVIYLEFDASLTPAVLLRFLNLCAQAAAGDEVDAEDLGALLWAEELTGINFTLGEDLPDGWEGRPGPSALDTAELPVGTGWMNHDVHLPDELAGALDLTVPSETPADAAAIAALSAEDSATSPALEIIYALVCALGVEHAEEDRKILRRALTEHLEGASGRGDAEPLRYAFSLAGDLAPSAREVVLPALSSFPIWAPLLDQLRTAAVPGGPTLLDLLAGLGRNGVALACQLLGDAPDRVLRRHLCDWLIACGAGAVPRIATFATDSRWYLVRNVAYVLGEIGTVEGADALERMATHADARVRRQALRGLTGVAPQRVLGVARRALLDPNLEVRVTAVQALGRTGQPGTAELLASHLENPPEQEEEAGEAYRALAVLNEEGARQLLQERLLARSRKAQTSIRGVVKGLRLIRAQWAHDLLAAGARAGGETGTLCRAALQGARGSEQ
jgi:hypothetical protein